ncbi:MAG TPA: hypothetical protein VE444_08595 [Gaiellaceae bacterium]|jgi:hypothetical protein|nr:hypothetical protein [Gaiellaceae bacterium]
MLEIRVGDDVYGLGDLTADELVRRVERASPELVGGEPAPGSALEKLRTSAELEPGDLALVGVVLEAWFQETNGDVPEDARELQLAISRRLG